MFYLCCNCFECIYKEVGETISNSDFNATIGISLVSSIIGSIISVWLIQQLKKKRRKAKFKALYSSLLGNYVTYMKRDKKRTDKIQNIAIYKQEMNVLHFKGHRHEEDDKFEGKIVMNESMPEYGNGYYKHMNSDGNGVLKIYLMKQGELSADLTYHAPTSEQNYAYTWVKQ